MIPIGAKMKFFATVLTITGGLMIVNGLLGDRINPLLVVAGILFATGGYVAHKAAEKKNKGP